jgi:hypothetical protein
MISMRIATRNGTAALPMQRGMRATSSPLHQYVIEAWDDIRD